MLYRFIKSCKKQIDQDSNSNEISQLIVDENCQRFVDYCFKSIIFNKIKNSINLKIFRNWHIYLESN